VVDISFRPSAEAAEFDDVNYDAVFLHNVLPLFALGFHFLLASSEYSHDCPAVAYNEEAEDNG
jgi:hypothetical protein